MNPSTPPGEPRPDHSNKWTYGIAALVLLLVAAYFGSGYFSNQPQETRSPQALVAERAAERMAGVRCIGAKASPPEKAAIARLLAINTLAPHGVLPAWLPSGYGDTAEGPAASDVWQTLAAACPNAPAFGTPFGFPSADIEKELRADPAFAALSEREWAAIRQNEADFAHKAQPGDALIRR